MNIVITAAVCVGVLWLAVCIVHDKLAQWRAARIAADYRAGKERREREAANAPAFCQHCSALIPKTAGLVRFCQRCGQPPDGSALILRGPAPDSETLKLTVSNWSNLSRGYNLERERPTSALLACPCGGGFQYEPAGDDYRCDTCAAIITCAEAGRRIVAGVRKSPAVRVERINPKEPLRLLCGCAPCAIFQPIATSPHNGERYRCHTCGREVSASFYFHAIALARAAAHRKG